MSDKPPTNRPTPMSVFQHYVAHCTIAHQTAIRAMRDGQHTQAQVSALTIKLIHKLHRLETLYSEMGGGAVFGTPAGEYSDAELHSLFPDQP